MSEAERRLSEAVTFLIILILILPHIAVVLARGKSVTFKMAATSIQSLLLAVLLSLSCFVLTFADYEDDPEYDNYSSDKSVPMECATEKHVCQTLIKINSGEVIEEDPYCVCDGCLPEWRQDSRGLPWVHYERRDQTVMYRFCGEIDKEDPCQGNQTALHIETDIKGWNPRIREQYCSCSGTYHMMGWRKTATTWRYNYRCYKNTCNRSDPCVKHFVNGLGKTNGYKFMCQCEEGYHCPTQNKYEPTSVETDDKGDRFIYDYCELNLGRRKKASRYTGS